MQSPDSPLVRPGNPFERRLATAVAMAKPTLHNVGVTTKTLPGGTSLIIQRQGRGEKKFLGCWHPSVVSQTSINLTAGSVSDGITTFTPTVTGITVHYSSLNYVYLECAISVDILDGYVTGGVITAAILKSYTTTKTNTNTNLYVLLCTWQAGALVSRYKYHSMTVDIRDTGANATLARYIALP